MKMNSALLTIFYDGLCPLCSREIILYRKKDTQNKINFVDITLPGFSAEKEGLDPVAVIKIFHVKTADGAILTRVEAFAAIWKILPGFGTLTWLAEKPLLLLLMNAGYEVFAAVRPYLPRKKTQDCETETCAR